MVVVPGSTDPILGVMSYVVFLKAPCIRKEKVKSGLTDMPKKSKDVALRWMGFGTMLMMIFVWIELFLDQHPYWSWSKFKPHPPPYWSLINKASTFGPLASPPYPGGDVIVHVSVHFIVFFERAARAQRTELIIRSYFRVEKRVKTDRDSYYEHIFKFARPYTWGTSNEVQPGP